MQNTFLLRLGCERMATFMTSNWTSHFPALPEDCQQIPINSPYLRIQRKHSHDYLFNRACVRMRRSGVVDDLCWQIDTARMMYGFCNRNERINSVLFSLDSVLSSLFVWRCAILQLLNSSLHFVCLRRSVCFGRRNHCIFNAIEYKYSALTLERV